ncbi:protein kinase-like domain, LysM domain protein [Artemisia annua]|uniref:Protein kinase-like domain, LysM domain protein n=1 Tax=Artemisia annua TaxID=35608 RepID=A0A2U1NWA3_ARTAN|nr:protein kinase-like domain, LysM domain protein [Artemisia annua]
MNMFHFKFMLVLLFFTIKSRGQQMYVGNLVLDCDNTDVTGPSPAFLYTCNGMQPSCSSFLIFRTQPLYNTVMTISNLMSIDHTSLAHINNITDSNKILPLNKELIIPVTCSCSGEYYQANTSFVIPTDDDTYYTIANYTYQGLTTCSSLLRRNVYDPLNLHPGQKLQVPLRCACPTVSQTTEGTKYLLTYLITWKDSIKKISKRFKVQSQDLALANGFSSVDDDNIYPFTTLLVPLSTEPSKSMTRTLGQKSSLSKKYIIAGTITGTFTAVLFILFVSYLWWKSNRANRGKNVKWALPKDIKLGIASVDQQLKVHKFEEIEEATDGFSLQNRLSASVYKGNLKGKTVVIKQMGAKAAKEVKILQKFNHFNIIGLYGVCEHDRACYLVYEFMENGSLKEWLEDKNKTSHESQTWTNRIRIGLDIAKGLQYLHNFASPAYVHKDINSSNILLSKALRAKISKFGLARLSDKDQNGNSSIKCPSESKGYLAPEYLETGFVTTKTDVYAFGVVLLELVTGRKAVYVNDDDGEEVMLSEEVLSIFGDEKHATDKVNYLIDPRLQARHPLGFVIDQDELALRMIRLAIACLEPEPSRRLCMNEIVSTLMRIQIDAPSSETMLMV